MTGARPSGAAPSCPQCETPLLVDKSGMGPRAEEWRCHGCECEFTPTLGGVEIASDD